jgi:hypothetical protein
MGIVPKSAQSRAGQTGRTKSTKVAKAKPKAKKAAKAKAKAKAAAKPRATRKTVTAAQQSVAAVLAPVTPERPQEDRLLTRDEIEKVVAKNAGEGPPPSKREVRRMVKETLGGKLADLSRAEERSFWKTLQESPVLTGGTLVLLEGARIVFEGIVARREAAARQRR